MKFTEIHTLYLNQNTRKEEYIQLQQENKVFYVVAMVPFDFSVEGLEKLCAWQKFSQNISFHFNVFWCKLWISWHNLVDIWWGYIKQNTFYTVLTDEVQADVCGHLN